MLLMTPPSHAPLSGTCKPLHFLPFSWLSLAVPLPKSCGLVLGVYVMCSTCIPGFLFMKNEAYHADAG